jgi:hypothetical protein
VKPATEARLRTFVSSSVFAMLGAIMLLAGRGRPLPTFLGFVVLTTGLFGVFVAVHVMRKR